MSSVILSLILPWLSSVVALIQLSAVMLEAGWTDSPAQGGMHHLMEWLGSQGSWTDITLTLGATTRRVAERKTTTTVENVPLWSSHTERKRQTLGIKWHSREKAFTVMKAGDDILNHICHSWHSTQWLTFICIPFRPICPLNEVKVEWKWGWLFV